MKCTSNRTAMRKRLIREYVNKLACFNTKNEQFMKYNTSTRSKMWFQEELILLKLLLKHYLMYI